MCAPSQAGMKRAQKFWKDEDKVVGWIKLCLSEQKIKKTKDKKITCAVLGAAYLARRKKLKSPHPK